MNERVKILWSEAAESNFGDSWEEQTAFMSKFAQLIVLECSSICYKGLENGDEAASLLMNTFGVEE